MRLLRVLAVLALAGCVPFGTARPSGPRGRIVIAAGGTQGVYFAYAQALARGLRARDPRLRVRVVATTGSVDNLQRVARGEATIAFTAADAAADAERGRLPIAALARVYDDYMHLIAAPGARRSLGRLTGATVSIGPRGSGTRLIARRLLAAGGTQAAGLHATGLGLDESIDALRRHRIAAFFWSGGLPTPGVERLAHDQPLRLLPLGQLIDGLQARYGTVYRAAVIPSGMYGQSRQVATIAVPNLIVCREGAGDELVRLVVATLFDRRRAIEQSVSEAAALDRRAAIETAPVPLHRAALRWFRDTQV